MLFNFSSFFSLERVFAPSSGHFQRTGGLPQRIEGILKCTQGIVQRKQGLGRVEEEPGCTGKDLGMVQTDIGFKWAISWLSLRLLTNLECTEHGHLVLPD